MRMVKPAELNWVDAYTRLKPEDLAGGNRYARWGGFIQGLFQCRFGKEINSYADLQDVLATVREVGDSLVDLYMVTPDSNSLVVRRSPFVADLPDEGLDAFDIGRSE
jgi:hypothetical protein